VRACSGALAFGLLLAAGGCAWFPQTQSAWERPPPPIRTGAVVDAERLRRGELPNGLSLLVFEDSRLPLVSAGIAFRRGVAIETAQEAGVAGFTAELLTRGAGSRDALELAEVVDSLGASLDAGAGWDATTVRVAGLSQDLEVLFGLLGDVVRKPRFDPGEAEKVRSELLAALEKERDDPAALASQAFAETLYPDHRYGLNRAGVPEVVARLTPADAGAFHARVFTPGNALLFVAGDASYDSVRELAEAAFGDWPEGPVPEPAPAPPAQTPGERRIVIVDRPDLGQAQIVLGHEGIARTEPERLAASLMVRVLGSSGFSSRLMSRVRAQEGLTYSINAYFALRRHAGPFGVSTFTRVAEVGRVVGIVLEELERMRDEPLSKAELEAVRRLSAGGFVLGLETSADVTESLVDLDVYGLPPDSLDTFRGRIAGVSLEEVTDAARTLLHPERAAVIVVGPAELLRPQLEGIGQVEVVQP
jgi:zinc protease